MEHVCPSVPSSGFAEFAAKASNGLSWAVHPLVCEALQRFRAGLAGVDTTHAPFDASTAERMLVPRLFETVQRIVEPTLVLELNVARVEQRLHGDTPQARFAGFCAGLRSVEVRRALVDEYPELFRSIECWSSQWADAGVELLQRLAHDWPMLLARLGRDVDPGPLSAIDTGAGDCHRGGRSVAILEFASGWKLVYKPHSLSADVRFGELLRWLGNAGFDTQLRVPEIIDRGGYGWSEFAVRESCTERAQVERFYHRLGGLLAALYVCRGRDMHYGNLIAAGEHPIVVDLEALFHNTPDGGHADPALRAYERSVMATMLLPHPMALGDGRFVDLSAFGARSDQPFPFADRTRWDRPATDEMRVVRDASSPMLVARCRPQLDGVEVVAEEFAEFLLAGFRRAYRLLEAGRDELLAPGGWCERIGDVEVRFVARATAVYATILARGNQPSRLRNIAAREDLFAPLSATAGEQPHLQRLVAAERRDLLRGDVPVFTSRPDALDLWCGDGERIADVFSVPATMQVRDALRGLEDTDLAVQEALVRTAIGRPEGAAGELPLSRRVPRDCGDDPLALARAIGDELVRTAWQDDTHASWIGVDAVGSGGQVCIEPVDMGLYSGLSGCALFLAWLAVMSGEETYERLARKSLALLRHRLARKPVIGIGAYTGLGGIVYTLAHLGVLWDDETLLDEAERQLDAFVALVPTDDTLDLVGGSAGAILALVALHRVRPSPWVRRVASCCGEHVLARQVPQTVGAAWMTSVAASQPLTGLSHGAAGIAWALFELSTLTDETRFADGARAALAYERSRYVAASGNWPDFRHVPGRDPTAITCELAWCHGAPGIALARAACLPHVEDPQLRDEIAMALRTTIAAPPGRSDCLCHGELGNLEILRIAGACIADDQACAVGEARARGALRAIATRGCRCGGDSHIAAPGLMVGLAGVGYGALRLAAPEHVPSVLTLEPPRSTRITHAPR